MTLLDLAAGIHGVQEALCAGEVTVKLVTGLRLVLKTPDSRF